MFLYALISLAVAGTPAEDLQAILRTDEGRHYRTAAVCTPLAPVLEPMGALLLLLGAPSELHESEAFLELGRMLDPMVAEAGGVDLGGSLLIGMGIDGGPGMAAVPFAGDTKMAAALLRSAGPTIADHPEGGWVVTPEEGHKVRVQQIDDHLVFRRLAVPQTEALAPSPWLLRGLPDDPGCALFLDTEKGLFDALPNATAVALLPVEKGRDARVRVSSLGPIPPSFARRSPSARPFGSSTSRPLALLTVNVPGLELLKVPAIAGNLGIGPQEQRTLESVVFIEPGLSVAGFGSQDAPLVVATMGVLKPTGRPFSGQGLNRRVVRMLQGMDLPARKLGRRAFVVDVGGTKVYGATEAGRLSVGTDPLRVVEALVGHGTPWIQADFAAFAEGRAMALLVEDDLVVGGLQAGLHSTDRTWDLTVRTGGPPVEALDAVVALASPAYVDLRHRARAAEVERLMPTLLEAQEDHRARTGQYLALPPAPRPLAMLSTKAVNWVGGPGWDDLDFAPPEDLRGTYWVEIDEVGQVRVHGAIDIDGDGKPALWTMDREGLVAEETE